MAGGLDKQMVQEYYQRMSDKEILRILNHDLIGLTPEAQDVIKGEVKRRRLDFDIAKIDEAAREANRVEDELYVEEGCPVPQVVRVWLESKFLQLLNFFGEENTRFRKVLTAERWDFPVKYDGSERCAYETLKIVAGQMEIPLEKIKLDFYDEYLKMITSGTPGGIYWGKGESNYFEISIARNVVDTPEEMIAVLAHELAHVKLLGEDRMEENDEHATDMATIFFGLGIFGANAAFQTFNEAKKFGWSQSGYLKQMEWGYALALFAYVRQEMEPEWVKYLSNNVRADFRKGLNFINDNEELIFQPIE